MFVFNSWVSYYTIPLTPDNTDRILFAEYFPFISKYAHIWEIFLPILKIQHRKINKNKLDVKRSKMCCFEKCWEDDIVYNISLSQPATFIRFCVCWTDFLLVLWSHHHSAHKQQSSILLPQPHQIIKYSILPAQAMPWYGYGFRLQSCDVRFARCDFDLCCLNSIIMLLIAD